jgi:hypothetical protein
MTYATIGNVKFACPKEFFDLSICKGANYQALAEGVRIYMMGRERKDCGDFVLFDDS